MGLGRGKNATVSLRDGSNSKQFAYEAVSASGERVKATMMAPTTQAVVAALQREGYVPVSVLEQKKSAGDIDLTAWLTGGGVKLKWGARAEFARRLNQMLRAGISVPKALLSLAEDAPKGVSEMCVSMSEKVMSGVPLYEAMREHPRAFDDITVSYIEAGEQAGTLVATTDRLAEMLGKRASLQNKIKGVSAYPKMVGGSIAVIVALIIAFLVPMYAKIYASFNAELPAPTRALVWAADHFSPVGIATFDVGGITFFLPTIYPFNIGSFLLYIVLGVFIFRRKMKDNLEVGHKIDRIVYRLPLVGALTHKQSLQRWASTLSGSMATGVTMSRSIELAAGAAGSRWHRYLAPQLQEAVRTGRTISSEVAKHPDLYPPNVRTMMATGEETGELDTMLGSVSDALDSDIDAIVAGLSAKVEVALLLVLGVVVGGLLLVLYMPILQLAMTASKGLGGG